MSGLLNKREFLRLFASAVVAAPTAMATTRLMPKKDRAAEPRETVYERVMRTRTLRCAYPELPPITIVDPNTRKVSGIFTDVINEMGRRLNLKVDWAEEVGWDNITTGFETGRYEIFGSTIWPCAARAATALFSTPVFFSPVFMWVRADDHRFDNNIMKLNSPDYTLAIIDGDVTQSIADSEFPLARRLAATQTASLGEEFQDVLSGKADAMLHDPVGAKLLMAHNPGALWNPDPDRPVRVFANTIMMPLGETNLKTMIDTVIGEMIDDGTIERTIKKYVGESFPYYLVHKSYEKETRQ